MDSLQLLNKVISVINLLFGARALTRGHAHVRPTQGPVWTVVWEFCGPSTTAQMVSSSQRDDVCGDVTGTCAEVCTFRLTLAALLAEVRAGVRAGPVRSTSARASHPDGLLNGAADGEESGREFWDVPLHVSISVRTVPGLHRCSSASAG